MTNRFWGGVLVLALAGCEWTEDLGRTDGGQCVPVTCQALGKNCGQVLDGCGGVLSCGACGGNETCGGVGVANVCGPGTCVPTTCAAQGKNCGDLSDGCGSILQCGSCQSPQTCGGGGIANVCGTGCTPESDATFCARMGKNCGAVTAPDNCGASRTVSCGSCTSPETCGGGGTANVCGSGCSPETDAAFCARLGKNCGSVSAQDNCGASRTVSCGTCMSPESCGGGGSANVCGTAAACAITVGGTLTGTVTWQPSQSPVCIGGDVIVSGSASLNINAGVVVRFQGPYRLTVETGGRLSAIGTSTSPVVFTSAQPTPLPGDWGPIELLFDSTATLRYTTVEYGAGLSAYYTSPSITDSRFVQNAAGSLPGVITVESQGSTLGHSGVLNPTLQRNVFEGNQGTCIALLRSGGDISRNSIQGCTADAISIKNDYNDADPVIAHNLLQGSGGAGVRISSAGSFAPTISGIEYNVIRGNRYGFYMVSEANFTASHNNITDNSDKAVYLEASFPSGSSSATDNWWGTTDASAIEASIRQTSNHTVSYQPFLNAPEGTAGP